MQTQLLDARAIVMADPATRLRIGGEWGHMETSTSRRSRRYTLNSPDMLAPVRSDLLRQALAGYQLPEHIREAARESLQRLPPHEAAYVDDVLVDIIRDNNLMSPYETFEMLGGFGEMPVLESIAHSRQIDLSNTSLVAVQHLLGSNVRVFMLLMAMGLDPKRMIVLGKCYSEHIASVWLLRSMGVTVIEDPSIPRGQEGDDGPRVHEQTLEAAAHRAVGMILDGSALPARHRIVLMDDGGLLVRAACQKRYKLHWKSMRAVEQTSRGRAIVQNLMTHGLHIPVVDIARSESKHLLESPLIGLSVVESLLPRVMNIRKRAGLSQSAPNVLVVGYGNVGSWTYAKLRRDGYVTLVYDPKLTRSGSPSCCADISSGLRAADLIIGCSGTPWFISSYKKMLRDGAVVASASTADVEFGRVPRGKYLQLPFDPSIRHLPRSMFTEVHSDYQTEHSSGRMFIANGGYPCNFDGQLDPIRPELIQVTRALMLAGVLQAAGEILSPGIVPLRQSDDDEISRDFMPYLRNARDLPVDAPTIP